jgi:Flp pilus assembly protein TadG
MMGFRRLLAAVGRLRRAESGVAAVEFALLASILLLVYALVFETGRGWLATRKLNSMVENVARFAARFPEFDQNVRNGIPLVAAQTLAPLDMGGLNLALFSARISRGEPVADYSHLFYGTVPTINWKDQVDLRGYAEGETVIIVVGSYSYRPILFQVATGDIDFAHVVSLNPFFSRSYTYQAGMSDFARYNVR